MIGHSAPQLDPTIAPGFGQLAAAQFGVAGFGRLCAGLLGLRRLGRSLRDRTLQRAPIDALTAGLLGGRNIGWFEGWVTGLVSKWLGRSAG